MIQYTKEDMKVLADLSTSGSVCKVLLRSCDYDPDRFREILEQHHLKKDIRYLFEMPFEEIPLLINKGEVSGYLSFRLHVGK